MFALSVLFGALNLLKFQPQSIQAVNLCFAFRNSAWLKTTDAYATTIIWSAIEVGIGILCACLPVLQPILKIALSLASESHARSLYQMNNNRNAKLPFRSWYKNTYRMTIPEKDARSSFAQVETNAVRDPDPYANRVPEAAEARIAVTTRIEQQIDKLP